MDELRILVVGDTHGHAGWLQNTVIPHAAQVGASKIVQVGDFGFVFPGMAPGVTSVLPKLNKVCARYGVDLHFLPGNHEDHDTLKMYEEMVPERSEEGHVPLADRVFYTGRVSSWRWGGQRFAAVGGAVSIDKAYRTEYYRTTGTQIWWATEELSEAEVARACTLDPVDVLFTHDAPTYNPFNLIPDLDGSRHREYMTRVGRALQPLWWFHGHHHRSEVYPFRHDSGEAEVRSLGRDGAELAESTELLSVKVL